MSEKLEKENYIPTQFKKLTLSDKAMEELSVEFKKIDKKTAEARKLLEKELPFASEKTLEMRLD